MTAHRAAPAADDPVIVVLASHWESSTEDGWFLRQVAGALACVADVHVITPEGRGPGVTADGAFTVHALGHPLDPSNESRRDLLVESIVGAGLDGNAPLPPSMARLLDSGLIEPWDGASEVVARLAPCHVVVGGHRNVGARRALAGAADTTPISVVALGSHDASLHCSHFDRVVDGAHAVLTTTATEQTALAGHKVSSPVHQAGAPLAKNTSVLDEPNDPVYDREYVFVIAGTLSDDHGEDAETARLLRLRFPETTVAVSHTDCLQTWHRGFRRIWGPIRGSTDMARMMAWARVTVDLRPGALFARRSIESLLYGTPIVVPHDSRAREHAERGRGGLWFEDTAELVLCVEALLDGETRSVLGAQGQAYAEAEYGSTDRFIARTLRACGMVEEADRAPTLR